MSSEGSGILSDRHFKPAGSIDHAVDVVARLDCLHGGDCEAYVNCDARHDQVLAASLSGTGRLFPGYNELHLFRSLDLVHPAVHCQFGARHKARIVRGEEQRGATRSARAEARRSAARLG